MIHHEQQESRCWKFSFDHGNSFHFTTYSNTAIYTFTNTDYWLHWVFFFKWMVSRRSFFHLQIPVDSIFYTTSDLLVLISYSWCISDCFVNDQATQGPCNTPKPSMLDFVNKAKWDAWKSLGSVSQVFNMNIKQKSNLDPFLCIIKGFC